MALPFSRNVAPCTVAAAAAGFDSARTVVIRGGTSQGGTGVEH